MRCYATSCCQPVAVTRPSATEPRQRAVELVLAISLRASGSGFDNGCTYIVIHSLRGSRHLGIQLHFADAVADTTGVAPSMPGTLGVYAPPLECNAGLTLHLQLHARPAAVPLLLLLLLLPVLVLLCQGVAGGQRRRDLPLTKTPPRRLSMKASRRGVSAWAADCSV
jgi:hypothetical protein